MELVRDRPETLGVVLVVSAERNRPGRRSWAPVVYTTIPDLEQTIDAGTSLSDAEWRQQETSFVSQVRLYRGYLLGQAVKLGDPYLLHWAAVHLVNVASRALLAYLKEVPDGFLDLSADLLARADGREEH